MRVNINTTRSSDLCLGCGKEHAPPFCEGVPGRFLALARKAVPFDGCACTWEGFVGPPCQIHAAIAAYGREMWNAALSELVKAHWTQTANAMFARGPEARKVKTLAEVADALKLPETREGADAGAHSPR